MLRQPQGTGLVVVQSERILAVQEIDEPAFLHRGDLGRLERERRALQGQPDRDTEKDRRQDDRQDDLRQEPEASPPAPEPRGPHPHSEEAAEQRKHQTHRHRRTSRSGRLDYIDQHRDRAGQRRRGKTDQKPAKPSRASRRQRVATKPTGMKQATAQRAARRTPSNQARSRFESCSSHKPSPPIPPPVAVAPGPIPEQQRIHRQDDPSEVSATTRSRDLGVRLLLTGFLLSLCSRFIHVTAYARNSLLRSTRSDRRGLGGAKPCLWW